MPQPVPLFLRQSVTLKAAVLDCLTNTDPKPVHRLRTTTRRIEATLELLIFSASLGDLRTQAKPLRKLLRKIRSAAGSVRDLDVHVDLLENYRPNGDTAKLEKDLASARKKSASQLRADLRKNRRKLGQEFDRLQIILEPALDLMMSGGALADAARSWLAFALRGLDFQKDDDLHTIRKASKTARYLAEIGADDSKAAAALASRFERTQEALGEWHDSLLLEERALASLGPDAKTTQQIQADTRRLRQKALPGTKHLPKASRTAPHFLLH
jgi:CHAD domain-containing protein